RAIVIRRPKLLAGRKLREQPHRCLDVAVGCRPLRSVPVDTREPAQVVANALRDLKPPPDGQRIFSSPDRIGRLPRQQTLVRQPFKQLGAPSGFKLIREAQGCAVVFERLAVSAALRGLFRRQGGESQRLFGIVGLRGVVRQPRERGWVNATLEQGSEDGGVQRLAATGRKGVLYRLPREFMAKRD